MPPEIGRVKLPLIGSVPFALIGALMGVSALVFLVVLVLCVRTFRAAPPATAARACRIAAPAAQDPAAPARPPGPPTPWTGMSYDDLMDRAQTAVQTGRPDGAPSRAYRAAATHDEVGLSKVLLARYRLARCLVADGKAEEALSICEELAAVSRPGDRLWLCAQVTAIDALGEQGDWPEFVRRTGRLLRANSARYSDAGPLDRLALLLPGHGARAGCCCRGSRTAAPSMAASRPRSAARPSRTAP